MVDKEIIKALASCIEGYCPTCFYGNTDQRHCKDDLMQNALYLINRQQAEIERLTINMNAFGLGMKREKERADEIKAEAIKEYRKRLGKWLKDDVTLLTQQRYIMESAIEKTYEEMVGE